METTKLKRFAAHARKLLRDTVSTKLSFVLDQNSSARRENQSAVKQLEDEISRTSKDQVIEKVAYIWFNRFVALRFMDANNYTKIKVVSPEPSQFQPSILADAKMGHIDDDIVRDLKTREKIQALLANQTPSHDPQGEAYKLLVVAACNYYNHAMPFLFEKISDYTELLMPDDLLSGDSILAYTREAMTPDVCSDVEVIGWLYQFYIAEKKDEVFDGIKKNKKVTPENIPAATQLFTPNWIVRYMVQNSLGRLWKLNNPDSKLEMEYYIEPETKESDYLKISSPKELKICDPACGSGHILVYAFDLLYEIYKEAGYSDDDDIIECILTHNLYGIEIDERASELASFALTMKAAAKSSSKRRFFKKETTPNICKLEVIKFESDEIKSYMDAVGRDLFTSDLQETLKEFEEADNFGSLIVPKVQNVESILKLLESKDVTKDIFLQETHQRVLKVLKQADYLSQKYHVVVANPPYMGSKGMNNRLSAWAKDNYPDSKSDLFAMFMERTMELTVKNGFMGMINQHSWMFLSSYEKLRVRIVSNYKIDTMIHLGARAFDEIGGEVVQSTAFTLLKNNKKSENGTYIRLTDYKDSDSKEQGFFKNENRYEAKQDDFEKIPGSPIAYWINKKMIDIFNSSSKIIDDFFPSTGLQTGDNIGFIRKWFELSLKDSNIIFGEKWFKLNNGGDFRKWYGNFIDLLLWENNGKEIKNHKSSVIRNEDKYFKKGITWNRIATDGLNMRQLPENFIFDQSGDSLFFKEENKYLENYLLAFFNTKIAYNIMKIVAPTLNITAGGISDFPIIFSKQDYTKQQIDILTQECIDISKEEWDSRETSWDFTKNELLKHKSDSKIETAYNNYCQVWSEKFYKLHANEEELNRLFIDIYELGDELTPDVALKDITILKSESIINDNNELEFKADEIMKQFISYAVGVMFGRYSIDSDGLVVANLNQDYPKDTTFEIDDDNVIPILNGEWFIDDISERFFQFVKVTFGSESYEKNLDFIANALSDKNKNSVETIRKYFLKDFYTDHVKRYKKRPIYWMISSPKGSFQALIYMHRYKSDTMSVVLNDYLREFITKLEATRENLEAVSIKSDASGAEKTKALKEIENIKKMIKELREFEKDVLYPLATEKIEIDLDDGVKVNYPKFGSALKKIVGLESEE